MHFGNKEKKRSLTILVTIALAAASVFPSFAGQWETAESGGYKYKKDDNTYCRSEWLFDDGYWFHFGDDGLMQTGWISESTASEASESETDAAGTSEPDSEAAQADEFGAGDTRESQEKESNSGRWYYLESDPESSIPLGGCYLDTITPDGYTVDEDGLFEDMTDEASPSGLIGRLATGWALMHLGESYSQSRRMDNGFFDCSSLVYRAYRSLGIDISDSGDSTAAGIAKKMMKDHKLVSRNDLEVGDLVFYKNISGKDNGRYLDIGHVAMILDPKKPVGLVISASETDGKVILDDFSPYGPCIYARPGKNISEGKYINGLLDIPGYESGEEVIYTVTKKPVETWEKSRKAKKK